MNFANSKHKYPNVFTSISTATGAVAGYMCALSFRLSVSRSHHLVVTVVSGSALKPLKMKPNSFLLTCCKQQNGRSVANYRSAHSKGLLAQRAMLLWVLLKCSMHCIPFEHKSDFSSLSTYNINVNGSTQSSFLVLAMDHTLLKSLLPCMCWYNSFVWIGSYLDASIFLYIYWPVCNICCRVAFKLAFSVCLQLGPPSIVFLHYAYTSWYV